MSGRGWLIVIVRGDSNECQGKGVSNEFHWEGLANSTWL